MLAIRRAEYVEVARSNNRTLEHVFLIGGEIAPAMHGIGIESSP